jgi:hypothetical protein
MLSVYWINTSGLQEHIRDVQTFCIHFANENTRWFALVTRRYSRGPSFPIEWCRLLMCSRNADCCNAVGLGAQCQICRGLHGLMHVGGDAETVFKDEWRILLENNMGKKYD